MNMEYKARAGFRVHIEEGRITLTEFMKGASMSFDKSEISEIMIRKGMYDFPFLEKSVVIRLKNGKKYVIRRLKSKDAEAIYKELQ